MVDAYSSHAHLQLTDPSPPEQPPPAAQGPTIPQDPLSASGEPSDQTPTNLLFSASAILPPTPISQNNRTNWALVPPAYRRTAWTQAPTDTSWAFFNHLGSADPPNQPTPPLQSSRPTISQSAAEVASPLLVASRSNQNGPQPDRLKHPTTPPPSALVPSLAPPRSIESKRTGPTKQVSTSTINSKQPAIW
ncbi:hypothetical protein PGT21_021778 [Puccinia graminis f. sp. tritici]|uniref:Uncharacterized protein n=1 Tax=Puccinia graminis f. sp. tritici TaxID=56615 RepID=A0A5B0PLF2_PUCGR|nr:hypothetical protein PGT21_014470 [Puccinia graminis f. sp. tritici]KAA1077409.1 hypothetical protein PGT21_006483 [Puccinia graminis f. sp. tritici]KAA1101474.1 hypothetical protein PGT21_021778 [Puccinia graminis f. sp. tritici]